MIIIYGRRSFGRVDAHGGEHAQTSFAHIYYMPLIPISSFWVTQDLGSTARGFDIRASGKSILAAYLRHWAPLGALVSFGVFGASGAGPLGLVVALGFVAACVWAWSWRSVRGDSALRRSDFNVLAFYTRCDPARMPREMRQRLKAMLDERWAALATTHPPDDVAKYGAKSLDEAVVAYGLLRLAAIDNRGGAREAAERIFHGSHEPLPVGAGPYRGDDHTATASVLEQVAAAASRRNASQASAAPPRAPWWTAQRKAAAALVAGAIAVAGLNEEAPSLKSAQTMGMAELESAWQSERFVEVRCDTLESIGEFTNGDPAAMCMVGEKILPVVKTRLDAAGTVLVGKLRDIRARSATDWGNELRSSPQVFMVYLEVSSQRQSLIAAIICMLVLAAAAGIGVKLALAWRRSRKTKPNV